MTTCSESAIMWKIRKTFECEAVSEPICNEVSRAIILGTMPKFDDIKCECVSGDEKQVCRLAGDYIEGKMQVAGILKMIEELVNPDPNEEGEWR